jgi:hypothetical protein
LDRKLDENDLFPKRQTEKFRAETLEQAHRLFAVSVLALVWRSFQPLPATGPEYQPQRETTLNPVQQKDEQWFFLQPI